jgi:calcineurin-like phosphoesterase
MLLTGMPARFVVAKNDATLEGLLLDVQEQTGRCTGIRRIRELAE